MTATPLYHTCDHCDTGCWCVRLDTLRGAVCARCDGALDAMLSERTTARPCRRDHSRALGNTYGG